MNPMFYVSIATSLILTAMMVYILKARNKGIMHYSLLTIIIEVLIWTVAVLMRGLCIENQQMVVFWENITYIGIALLPVSVIILADSYVRPNMPMSPWYALLLIVPVGTFVMIWTNDAHNLFYVQYAWGDSNNIAGTYFYIHAGYSYICLLIGYIRISYFAVKNSGIFSVQALLIIIGSLVPTVVNVLYTLQIGNLNVYSTPLAFTVTVILYMLALFRFNMLKVMPVALQTVINRISDSFVVVDPELNIIDFNKPFTDNFLNFSGLRKGQNFYKMLGESNEGDISADGFRELIEEVLEMKTTLVKDLTIDASALKQYFTVEFTPIVQRERCVAVILLYKNITQHIRDVEQIQENQAVILERERLVSLGQLIGGIAHNLKTPIMSVAGGIDQVQCLVEEYTASILDDEVSIDDHKEIAAEMQDWLAKMKTHMAYMSDIISTVKDQATKFNNPEETWFTLDELLKRVKILMQHELAKNSCRYRQYIRVDRDIRIGGDINSMVQVLDNIIVNAIQSYNGRGGDISIRVTQEGGKLLITVSDSGNGIPEDVKDRLFKEMITTKGKHGTGLGLYMSHSTVKGMFRGDMWFESRVGQGTKFFIQVPLSDDTEAMEDEQDA